MKNLERVIGYVLLTPPIVGVLLFFIMVIRKLFSGAVLQNYFYDSFWTGFISESDKSSYTSSLPVYFGLMALAGAYLIKDSKKE
jgi:hypothetical protein